jgi:hypothetical protein
MIAVRGLKPRSRAASISPSAKFVSAALAVSTVHASGRPEQAFCPLENVRYSLVDLRKQRHGDSGSGAGRGCTAVGV